MTPFRLACQPRETLHSQATSEEDYTFGFTAKISHGHLGTSHQLKKCLLHVSFLRMGFTERSSAGRVQVQIRDLTPTTMYTRHGSPCL